MNAFLSGVIASAKKQKSDTKVMIILALIAAAPGIIRAWRTSNDSNISDDLARELMKEELKKKKGV